MIFSGHGDWNVVKTVIKNKGRGDDFRISYDEKIPNIEVEMVYDLARVWE